MIEELKSNTRSLFFWGCYLYELGLSQEERTRLGMPPLTDAEKEFVANLKKGIEKQKEANEELKELPKKDNEDRDDFVTLRIPLKDAAPGWGLKLQKPVFPHVDIPKQDCMDSSAVKPLGELIGRKLDEEMTAFGNEHGFTVIFVFYPEKTETNGGIFFSWRFNKVNNKSTLFAEPLVFKGKGKSRGLITRWFPVQVREVPRKPRNRSDCGAFCLFWPNPGKNFYLSVCKICTTRVFKNQRAKSA